MTEQEYKAWFCNPSDVSKAEIMREAISNAKKKGHRTSKFWKMRRWQLQRKVENEMPSLTE